MNDPVAIVYYPPDELGDPSVMVAYEPQRGTINGILEEVFRQFNRVDGTEFISRYDLQIRSLSVGDVVYIDGRAFICDMFGWAEVSGDFLDRWAQLSFRDRQLGVKNAIASNMIED